MEKLINLETLAEGGLTEKVNMALKDVLNNISDPNTDYKKKRKLIIELTFSSSDDRELASVGILTRTKLEPAKPIGTTFMIGTDGKGGIIASEYKKQLAGQSVMRVDQSTGEILTTAEEKENEKMNLDGIRLIK